jgi:hypothetical protein
MSTLPPPDIALSWCPGCGQMGILVHSIESFKTRNECARCRRGVVVQVALYRFDRLAAELSGFQLTQGSSVGSQAPSKPKAAEQPKLEKAPAGLPESEPEK